MNTEERNRPDVVSRAEWLAARKDFLLREKEFTRQRDALNAQRRRLPMVKIEKEYVFETPSGSATLADLFEGRRQLVIYHFMLDPAWDEGCPGCSHFADSMPHLAHLYARDTSFALVSRAPQAKIQPFKARMGWTLPWYSSFGSDFNYDFHVTLDEDKGSVEWNFESVTGLVERGKIPFTKGELPGLSVFLRDGGEIFHTYSTFARGLDPFLGVHQLLDMTPYGRQENWEDSPDGWPQTPGDWLRHHDKYEHAASAGCCHGE